MFYQTNRTITDIPTGRTLRLFHEETTHKREYRDEATGETVQMAYVNGTVCFPVDIRTEDGQTLTVQGEQGVNSSLNVTHIRHFGKKRFQKL